ncbi:MAG: ATP-binding protein, partial [Myxococcota bacterium]
ILNQLVHNAVESNPTSGVVEIEGRIREGWLYLTIRDDGAGMDQAAQRRVFEPLFTTKSGVGVGMSLAAARPRLQQWGGDIFLHSTIDVGTAVTLKVRLVPRRPRPVQRGRVLIVEDEPHIARALKRLFGRNNDVELAHDGNDVLVRYAPTDFDVAIIDLSMPQMSGDTLAHALRERDPTLSLILLTGWLIQPDDPLMEGFDGLLQKPLTDLSTARQRIAEAIATTRQRRAATPPGSPPG